MYSGINLIGLMISSVLGIFIISVIIKISITINNNLQLIQAYIELEQSARIIQKFFESIFNANGGGLVADTRTNDYFIDSNNKNAKFSMWYTESTPGAISCSGRQLKLSDPKTPSDNQITVSMGNYSGPASNDGFITCKNGIASVANGDPTSSIKEEMPLVNSKQVVQFFIAAIVSDPSTATGSTPANIRIIPVKYANATTNPPPSTPVYNSVGIKLAILLRSTQKVLNAKRTVVFNNILNFADDPRFNFTATNDDYLYKLVIIQKPFSNNPRNAPLINTRIIRS